MIENRAPIASMFLFQSYTITIMIGRNLVNRDRCMTFDILTYSLSAHQFCFHVWLFWAFDVIVNVNAWLLQWFL
jgi:hypothetical protein